MTDLLKPHNVSQGKLDALSIDVKALREFIASPASLDQVESSDGKRKDCTYREQARRR